MARRTHGEGQECDYGAGCLGGKDFLEKPADCCGILNESLSMFKMYYLYHEIKLMFFTCLCQSIMCCGKMCGLVTWKF